MVGSFVSILTITTIGQYCCPIMRQIGPYSKPNRLAILDGRTMEAKLMARIRRELTEHVGGSPTATQRILIDRAAALSLRLQLMDREAARSGDMSERNGRQYLAWSASLTRVVKQIGLNEAPAPKPRWQPPIDHDQPPASPTAASARSARLAQRAAELAVAK